MKRYKINSKVERVFSPLDMTDKVSVLSSVVEENETGPWVLWSDVAELLERQKEAGSCSLDKRLDKIERALGLASEGKCPECEKPVRDYKVPTGYFAPEIYATLREHGINPINGHKFGCSLGKVGGKA